LWRLVVSRPKTTLVILVAALGVGWCGLLGWREYHFQAAQQAVQFDRLPQALHHLDRCRAIGMSSAAVCLLAARIHRLRSEFSLVEQNLKECKRVEGGMTERLQLEWTLLRAHMGDLASVEEQLLVYVQNNHPQADLIYESLAFAYMQDLRYGAALWCLDQWLKREPDSIRARDWRGWTRNRMEFRQGALEDFEEVLKRAPDHWQTSLRLAQFYLLEARPQEAKGYLDNLLAEHPEQPEVKVALARYEISQNHLGAARLVLDELLEQLPHFVPARYLRATLEEDPTLREKKLRKILADEPGNLEARYALGLCLGQQSRQEEARKELERYNEIRKDWETLKTLFKKVEQSPRDPDLLVQTGRLLLRTDRILGQVFLYKAMDIDPGHPGANQALAEYSKENPNWPAKRKRK
jgi:tetratricopeptide (TPR) repeat protein